MALGLDDNVEGRPKTRGGGNNISRGQFQGNQTVYISGREKMRNIQQPQVPANIMILSDNS